jgi:hypothetical protein
MTTDWYEGLLPTRWWWKSLFKTSDVTSMLLPTWLDSPIYAPAALQYLAVRSLAIPFVRSLSHDNARLLLRKIIHTFSLSALHQALSNSENDTDLVLKGNRKAEQARRYGKGEQDDTQMVAPWQHIVPEGGYNELFPYSDQQCLLGIGLMLQRAPMRLRTQSFAQAVQRWQRTALTAIADDQAPLPARDGRPIIVGDGPARGTIPTAPFFGPTDETSTERDERSILVGQGKTGEGGEWKAAAVGIVPRAGPSPEDEPSILVGQGKTGEGGEWKAGASPPVAQGTPAIDETPPEIHIDTVFGGLFYLINLALFLNLYNDFTSPMNVGIELPIWDFIALLGLELIGEAIKQDPIWPLLAQLAERDVQDAPGKDFTPPDIWQIPPEWLKQFSGDEEEWATEKKFEHGEEPFQSWLNWLMPSICARLQRALNLDAKEQIAPMLVIHDAHVRLTATHLDVFFSLNTLPIEIRLAGLDRNPGWVPAAGRFISFYFS